MFTKKPESDADMDEKTEDAGKTELKTVETRQPLTPRTPPSHAPSSAGPSLIGEDLTVLSQPQHVHNIELIGGRYHPDFRRQPDVS